MARLLLLSLLGAVLLSVGQSKVLPSNPQNAVSYSAGDVTSNSDWLQMITWDDKADAGNDVNSVDLSVDESDPEDELDDELDNYLDKIDDLKDKDDGIEFPLDDLSDEEVTLYMNLEDQILVAQVDEHIAAKLLKESRSLLTNGVHARRKRIAPLIARAAFAVGRHMFRSFARSGVTRSGSRITRHYNGRGNFGTALKDFERMRPTNVKSFSGRISGRTGTVGNHRVTVRDGSSGNSRPTLEVRSHGGSMVRKFRYNN